jgi:hypothetical protein
MKFDIVPGPYAAANGGQLASLGVRPMRVVEGD